MYRDQSPMMSSLASNTSSICPIDQVLGVTHTFSFNKACWKLELFDKGALKVDLADSTCSNTVSTSYDTVMSLFSRINKDSNVVIHTASEPQQCSGSF